MTTALPITEVKPDPDQHRKHFDPEALQELADSIRSLGQLSPIIVRKNCQAYIIVAGERRYRAMLGAGFRTIMAEVKDLTDTQTADLQAAENIARRDVCPTEEGRAYQRVIDAFTAEHFPPDFETLGESAQAEWRAKANAHCAKVTESNFQRIGCKTRLLLLPEEVRRLVDKGSLSEASTQMMTRLVPKPEETDQEERLGLISQLARTTVAQKLDVHQVRAKVGMVVGARDQCTFDLSRPVGNNEAPNNGQAARSKAAQGEEHLALVSTITWDTGKNALLDFSGLAAHERATFAARLRGSLKHLANLLEAVEPSTQEEAAG